MKTIGYVQALRADETSLRLASILQAELGQAFIALPDNTPVPPLPDGVEAFSGPEDPVERIFAFNRAYPEVNILRVPSICPPELVTEKRIRELIAIREEEQADLCYDPALPRHHWFELTAAAAFPRIEKRVGRPFTYNRHYLFILHNFDGFRVAANLPPRERERQAKVDARCWFHSIDFGNGVKSHGFNHSERTVNAFNRIPPFTGQRVLDIAMNDGLYSFLAEQRGADAVVGIDVDDYANQDLGQGPAREVFDRMMLDLFGDTHRETLYTGNFALARELLRSNVTRMDLTVYDLNPAAHGMFDTVFMFGLLYHLLHPMLALQRMRSVCRGVMYLQTIVDPAPGETPAMRFTEEALYVPDLKFYDPTNWWVPDLACLKGMLRTAGFHNIEEMDVADGYAFLRCS